MKKKIIFGSLLVVSILMMLPSISALQFNNIKDANKENNIEIIKNLSFEDFEEKIKDNTYQSQSYNVLHKGNYYRIFYLIKKVILSKLFRNIYDNIGNRKNFNGLFEKLKGSIAIPIIIIICTIFGISLFTIAGISIPLIYIFTKIINMIYCTIFGLSTQALKSIMLLAILVLF